MANAGFGDLFDFLGSATNGNSDSNSVSVPITNPNSRSSSSRIPTSSTSYPQTIRTTSNVHQHQNIPVSNSHNTFVPPESNFQSNQTYIQNSDGNSNYEQLLDSSQDSTSNLYQNPLLNGNRHNHSNLLSRPHPGVDGDYTSTNGSRSNLYPAADSQQPHQVQQNTLPRTQSVNGYHGFSAPRVEERPRLASTSHELHGQAESDDEEASVTDKNGDWVIPEPVYSYNGTIDNLAAFIEARDSRSNRVCRLDEKEPGVLEEITKQALVIFNAFLNMENLADRDDAQAVSAIRSGVWSKDDLYKASYKIVMDAHDMSAGAPVGTILYGPPKSLPTKNRGPHPSIDVEEYRDFDARFKAIHSTLWHEKKSCKAWLDEEYKPFHQRLVAHPGVISRDARRNQRNNDRRRRSNANQDAPQSKKAKVTKAMNVKKAPAASRNDTARMQVVAPTPASVPVPIPTKAYDSKPQQNDGSRFESPRLRVANEYAPSFHSPSTEGNITGFTIPRTSRDDFVRSVNPLATQSSGFDLSIEPDAENLPNRTSDFTNNNNGSWSPIRSPPPWSVETETGTFLIDSNGTYTLPTTVPRPISAMSPDGLQSHNYSREVNKSGIQTRNPQYHNPRNRVGYLFEQENISSNGSMVTDPVSRREIMVPYISDRSSTTYAPEVSSEIPRRAYIGPQPNDRVLSESSMSVSQNNSSEYNTGLYSNDFLPRPVIGHNNSHSREYIQNNGFATSSNHQVSNTHQSSISENSTNVVPFDGAQFHPSHSATVFQPSSFSEAPTTQGEHPTSDELFDADPEFASIMGISTE